VVADYSPTVNNNYAKQAVVTVDGATFLKIQRCIMKFFGPYSLVVQCDNTKELEQIIATLEGQFNRDHSYRFY